MNVNDEIREILIGYFKSKIEKYEKTAAQDDVEKLSWDDAKNRTKEWAYIAGTNEKVAAIGAVFGGVAGGAIGGLIGLPILGVAEVATAPLGAVAGVIVGTGVAMGGAACAGAGSAIITSGVQRGYQQFQQNKIDCARKLSSKLKANLDYIANNLLSNRKLFNVLSDLNCKGKGSRIKDIFNDYYKIIKQQAQTGEINVNQALKKLESKSSVKGSVLSRLSMFARSKSSSNGQQCEEVDNGKGAIRFA